MTAADAIVVGGGVAGCVIATRLAEGGRRVVLIEGGPGEPRPPTVAGLDTIAASQERSRLWPNLEVADRDGGSSRPYRQGFGLGGGSMVNSLVLSPGDAHCYDRWRDEYGCEWDAAAMAPWLELAAEVAAGEHATQGPLGAACDAAAVAAGHESGGSSSDQGRAGVMRAKLAKVGERRRSSIDGYRLLAGESTLGFEPPTVRTDSMVASVAVDDRSRATGVVLSTGERIDAPLVVVCCGAIQTPALLQRSGLTARPVGDGLKDHPSFAFTVARSRSTTPQPLTPRAVSTVLRWSSGERDDLDLQAIVVDRVGEDADGSTEFGVVVVGLMDVTSRGAVVAQPDRPNPTVTTGALTTDVDRRRLRSGVLSIHNLLRRPEMTSLVDQVYVDAIGTPAAALSTMAVAELDQWLVDHPGPYAHPACSCPMGPPERPSSVVSGLRGELGRLLDYRGIYVADASIMPDLVNGGLQLPVAAIAERIASELVVEA